jgi:hypothetical protein
MRGRTYVELHFDRQSVLAQWDQLLADMAPNGQRMAPIHP